MSLERWCIASGSPVDSQVQGDGTICIQLEAGTELRVVYRLLASECIKWREKGRGVRRRVRKEDEERNLLEA